MKYVVDINPTYIYTVQEGNTGDNFSLNKLIIRRKNFKIKLVSIFPGSWGGIWKAPNQYLINSENRYQTGVSLLKKFSDWEYQNNGIQERLPYRYKQRLTMSSSDDRRYGSITGMKKREKTF